MSKEFQIKKLLPRKIAEGTKISFVPLRVLCVFAWMILLPVFPGYAAEPAVEDPMAEYSASGLLGEATGLLEVEDYSGALPYLEEYQGRMRDSDDPRVKNLLQEVRLKLGKIQLQLAEHEKAVNWLDQYMASKPLYKRREVLKLQAISLYETAKYEKCITAIADAFRDVSIEELGIPKEKVRRIDDLNEEERGGMTARQLKRYEKQEEEARPDRISADFSSDAPEAEPEYTVEERVLLNMTLAEAHAALGQWEESLEPYRYVVENAAEQERQGYAVMQMAEALLELKRYAEARDFILQLAGTDARYDIRVNMALISTAAALFNVEEYDSALLLYRLVFPRGELLVHQVEKMNAIRRSSGLPDVEVKITTNKTGRVETLFGSRSAVEADFQDEVSPGFAKPMELILLEESAGTLMALPPYETDVLYRTGQLYAQAGRPWEAVAVFNVVSTLDLGGKMGNEAFYQKLLVFLDPLKEHGRIETEATAFLAAHSEGLPPRQIAYVLAASYQKQDRMKDIKGLLPVIEAFTPSDDRLIRRYECELYYMQAIADMMLLNYKEALIGFAKVLKDFSHSHQEDNTTYWHALCRLFLQEYKGALEEFEAYSQEFPKGSWLNAASFRGGICLYSLERYEEAMERFTYVIETWPDSRNYPDACSLRGDLFAADGLLTEAQCDYEEAIATARNEKQDTYATFQMVTMFEMEERYDEMLSVVDAYLERRGDEADVAKAAYWIGKTKLAQGLTREALEAYLETVVEYGESVRQDGVDLIIGEIVNVSRRLEPDDRDWLAENLKQNLSVSTNATVRLRLRVTEAKINGTETELGRSLMQEKQDITQVPPPVLALISEAFYEQKDYSRAEEILTLFHNHFEDSDFMRSAYKLRAFDLYSKGEADTALKLVNDAQALYGTDADMAWAQLMKGRLEFKLGDAEAGRKTLRQIFGIRAWRGAPYAEAAYALGEAEEQAGELRKAFAWYQRTYTLYKGYAKGHWAAEAYLASARVLKTLGRNDDAHNTYRAMLYDQYVNSLPQAGTARQELAPEELAEIAGWLTDGVQTNLTVEMNIE